MNQPAPWQIVAYNVTPAPLLRFSTPLIRSVCVTAYLIESSTNHTLKTGFVSGNTKTAYSGTCSLAYSGLKLNKMIPIKNELEINYGIKVSDTTFFIKFTCGDLEVCTQPFRLTSSCSMLRPDVRETVRPTKNKRKFDEIEPFTEGSNIQARE